MIEITLQIKFAQACLGHKQKRDERGVPILCMPRGVSGRVMFPPAWWRAVIAHGARVKGGSVNLANKVEWSLDLDGTPRRWTRHGIRTEDNRTGQVQHEAFLPGDVVAVDCVLPEGLTQETFRRWMEAGGKYVGISPYKPREWGRFEVVSVTPIAETVSARRSDGGNVG